MRVTFEKIGKEYLAAKTTSISGHYLAKYIREEAPNKVRTAVPSYFHKHFGFRGSPGIADRWANVPWISVFEENNRIRSENNLYATYYFSSDLRTVNLSLTQDVNQIEKKYGGKCYEELVERANQLRRFHSSKRAPHMVDKIKLNPQTHLAKRYEAAHILGFSYDINRLPSDNDLSSDLKTLLEIYLTRLKF